MKKKLPVIIAVVLIIVIIAITMGVKVLERFSYSKERMDLGSYYGIESGEDVALVLNNEIKEEKGRLSEGRCYLPLDTVHAYLNDRFYADYNENLLLYTTPDEIIRAEGGSAGEEGYVPAFMDNGVMYVALDYVKNILIFPLNCFRILTGQC